MGVSHWHCEWASVVFCVLVLSVFVYVVCVALVVFCVVSWRWVGAGVNGVRFVHCYGGVCVACECNGLCVHCVGGVMFCV
jgi:hypothetical protein